MPLPNKKIRWGILGLGHIANSFANDLLTLEDVELYAVASRKQEKSDEFAHKYDAKIAYGSYDDLVKDKNVDAIYIATPHVFHKENSLLCLKHGKAVLCEKPFAMNAEEVHEMIACAKEGNVLFMEALWTYFLPHFRYVLELLNRNEFGKLLKLEADFGFETAYDPESRLFKKELGGGSLLDIGIYPIFVALSTLGIPKKMKADAVFLENGIDTSCHMVFEYENKVKAFLKSTITEKTPTTATFYCEKGVIKINHRFFAPTTVSLFQNGKEETLHFETATKGYNFEIQHFNQLLRDGKTESDIMSFDFSKKLISLLDEVRAIIGLEY